MRLGRRLIVLAALVAAAPIASQEQVFMMDAASPPAPVVRAWLPRLRPTGRALLVVQKHLGADSLQRWIDGSGRPTERVTSSGGSRILRIASPG